MSVSNIDVDLFVLFLHFSFTFLELLDITLGVLRYIVQICCQCAQERKGRGALVKKVTITLQAKKHCASRNA